MPLPVTVSGPRTDDSERNVGRNAILIAITLSYAGFIRDVPRHYAETNRAAERTGNCAGSVPTVWTGASRGSESAMPNRRTGETT